MLEWVCPGCGRDVDPSQRVCPFCGTSEAAPPGATIPEPGTRGAKRTGWTEINRGWRWGLGLIAAGALAYTILLLVFYLQGREDLFDRMLHWIGLA